MTFQEALKKGEEYLRQRGVENPGIDAWYILENVTDLDRAHYLLVMQEKMAEADYARFMTMLSRRGERIPLQHLTGEQEFMGLPFYVNEHVLIPRQDTEILVEEAEKEIKPGMKVLDLCTGSGCIIISLMKRNPGIRGTASDVSHKALETARSNARRNQVVVDFRESDLFEKIEGSFDLIVSNPPYIATDEISRLMAEVRRFEPMGALDGGPDGLYFYRKIITKSRIYLNRKGVLLFEVGHDEARQVTSLMEASGFTGVHTVKDLAGLDRVVAGRAAL